MYIKTIVTGSNFLCGSTKGTITQMVKSCWYGKCLVYVLISKLKSTDFLVHVLVSNTPASIGQGALLRQFINFRHDKLICGHCQFSVLWAEDLKKERKMSRNKTPQTQYCHQYNHGAPVLLFKNEGGREWIKGGKKGKVRNLYTDQRQAFKHTKQIRNKQRSCWVYYTTQVPHTKGPTCWAPV